MMPIMPARRVRFFHVFGRPLLLGLASAIGLLSALFGDGVWDVVSWGALGVPLAIIVWYVACPVPTQRHRP
jgi:hypothetical protein